MGLRKEGNMHACCSIQFCGSCNIDQFDMLGASRTIVPFGLFEGHGKEKLASLDTDESDAFYVVSVRHNGTHGNNKGLGNLSNDS
jgi:hypothetical protein